MSEHDITPEQRAAWLRWEPMLSHADRALIAPLLPSALTTPQPVLPTEPGVYVDAHDRVIHRSTTRWWTGGNYVEPETLFPPLRRLVVEREPITREQVINAITENNPHEPADFESEIADRILALVNGADR